MAGRLVAYDEDSPSEVLSRRNAATPKEGHSARRSAQGKAMPSHRDTTVADEGTRLPTGQRPRNSDVQNWTETRDRSRHGSDQGPRWRNEECDGTPLDAFAHHGGEARSFRGGGRRHDFDSKDSTHLRRRSRSRDAARGNYGESSRGTSITTPSHDRDDRHGEHRRGPRREDRTRQQYSDSWKREMYENPSSAEASGTLPAYANPRSTNVSRLMQQQEKRKLLWNSSKAKKEEAVTEGSDKKAAMWQAVAFAGDADGTVANKFKKLMGLKAGEPSTKSDAAESDNSAATSTTAAEPHILRQQEEIFRNLDRQYQMARLSAHTQRGVGLGFNSR